MGAFVLSAGEYRELAEAYRAKAGAPGLDPNKATELRNIARSLSALASQLEILDLYDKAPPKRMSAP
ncbi:hypothetical protein BKD09_16455 [Bradyrhizobium japonicum]|uniref:Uncharacterized protein n=1 Tax=Bradyrhizobium japonicum TaxID=375 RepID=A0A1L3F9E8_BRAJP|nr:hypothetical protein BKD09_16455 [Bradyrhizobium japonicum]